MQLAAGSGTPSKQGVTPAAQAAGVALGAGSGSNAPAALVPPMLPASATYTEQAMHMPSTCLDRQRLFFMNACLNLSIYSIGRICKEA